jgi:hypothetical protein
MKKFSGSEVLTLLEAGLLTELARKWKVKHGVHWLLPVLYVEEKRAGIARVISAISFIALLGSATYAMIINRFPERGDLANAVVLLSLLPWTVTVTITVGFFLRRRQNKHPFVVGLNKLAEEFKISDGSSIAAHVVSELMRWAEARMTSILVQMLHLQDAGHMSFSKYHEFELDLQQTRKIFDEFGLLAFNDTVYLNKAKEIIETHPTAEERQEKIRSALCGTDG